MGRSSGQLRSLVAVLVAAGLVAGCGADGDPGDAAPTTAASSPATTTPAPEPLRILLVYDDGIVNPAIDVLLGVLSAEPAVEVTVVAPADERSGSSDTVTEGGATYEESTTPGGVAGYAVDGYPADAVLVGIDELGVDPHLVLSGVNPGQNVGPLAAASGTVGAGRTAIRRGIPALAVSGPLELDEEQFTFAAELALDWVREHRDALLARTHPTEALASINVPACEVADMGELQEVPLATAVPAGVDVFGSGCDQADPAPATDVAALVAGYPSISQVPAEL